MTQETTNPGAIPFRAETRQLLDILIHSLYTEREVFLRELISNASDALTRMSFEMLTNRDVLEPETELAIWITTDPAERTLTIRDTGVGMTRDELVENLGTIAHSGARDFLKAAQETHASASEIIGQFGVGFYSAFMVAEWIRVTTHSYRSEVEAQTWFSAGEDTYTLEPATKTTRGTEILVKLKEDAAEFAEENRLREVIRKHSDFIPYPIYLGSEASQVNQRSALWRQNPREVEQAKYDEFYRQFTLDFQAPLAHTHMVVDAPVQLYALLYIPTSPERTMFSARKEDGLKLYARKVLIQEYSRDLLPEYFRFITGVVDSEDLQLNVSRESIQSSRVMAQIRRALTGKVLEMIKKLAQEPAPQSATKATEAAAEEATQAEEEGPEPKYATFWKTFSRFIKEGIATAGAPTPGGTPDKDAQENLPPLLRFHSLNQPETLLSLDDYVAAFKPEQKKIYYILGDDERSALHSPHLDVFRHTGVDVLLMADPLDPFVLLSLGKYKDFALVNAAVEKPEVQATEPAEEEKKEEAIAEDTLAGLVQRFKDTLGERVADVRTTDRLIDSPARLVDTDGALNQEIQRAYRAMRQEFDAPKKVLEINPRHAILKRLAEQPAGSEVGKMIIEQIFEDALLIEGLHPDPVSMIERIQELMKAALK
ncbi:MAG TPA: molecular chaperone HtpG [Anaerolineaceae bacterium]